MGEDRRGRLEALLDGIGVPSERDKCDQELIEWFEADTGFVLPADYRAALPRISGFHGHAAVAVQWWSTWGVEHLGLLLAVRKPENPRGPVSLHQSRFEFGGHWGECLMEEPEWFGPRADWVEQLLPFAWNSRVSFCFDYRFDSVNPPVVIVDQINVEDAASIYRKPVEYAAPDFTTCLEQVGSYEVEDTPYEPTEHHLAWNQAR